ncbi:hypothetical protein V6N13_113685 [Hibiscus sabdariffa]|uniref:Uncharacterized protein n=1 Tax=Hibiscus sabdariffa TaxID=183260 RepID=A0ABR2TZR5_9ROSI
MFGGKTYKVLQIVFPWDESANGCREERFAPQPPELLQSNIWAREVEDPLGRAHELHDYLVCQPIIIKPRGCQAACIGETEGKCKDARESKSATNAITYDLILEIDG